MLGETFYQELWAFFFRVLAGNSVIELAGEFGKFSK
jgi:hypothetical protein